MMPTHRPGGRRRARGSSPQGASPLARLLAAAGVALAAHAARAQVEFVDATTNTDAADTPSIDRRPEAARRVLRLFDFEEQLTNPAPVPRYWYRGQEDRRSGRVREGFPSWNQADLDYTHACAGQGSVRLPTRGGSTSLVLERGVLPVFPGAHYLISAKVKTQGLSVAGAAIIARMLDRSGRPIPGAEHTSPVIRSEDHWSDLVIQTADTRADAGFLELELVLLQPARFEPGHARDAAGLREDLSGSAWFDDVRVAQTPQIDLTTGVSANIVVAPQHPELRLALRDLTGEALDLDVEITDDRGRTVHKERRTVGTGLQEIVLRPSLDKFGWYRARVDVQASRVWVGGSELDFVWLPAETVPGQGGAITGSADRRRFSLVMDEMPWEHRADVRAVVERSGCGGWTLPVWSAGLTKETLETVVSQTAELTRDMSRRGTTVSLALCDVPDEIRQGRKTTIWSVFREPEAEWFPYLEPFLDRFGQVARRWQVGPLDSADAPVRPNLAADLDRVRSVLGRLVPGPIVVAPWGPEYAAASAGLSSEPWAAISATHSDLPSASMPALARTWDGSGVDSVTFVMPALDTDTYGEHAGAAEVARRVIELWARWSSVPSGGPKPPDMIAALREPWRMDEEHGLMPRAEVAAWRTLVDRLCDRRVVGEFPVGTYGSGRVKCYILAPAPGASEDRGGALVAWNQSAEPEDAVLRAPLGGGRVRVVDIYGNERPAGQEQPPPMREGDALPAPLAVVPLDGTPVFIEGIDLNLARFLASFRITPPLLLATNATHDHEIEFENPWTEGLNGRLWIVKPDTAQDPGGRERIWRISPRFSRFNIAPGQAGRVPFRVAFDPAEDAGPKEFLVEFELTAGRQYGRVLVRTTVELGLKDLRLDVTCRLGPDTDGPDVLVEATVTNLGAKDMNVDLTAFAPDLPRERASISGLAPGVQVQRRFIFADAAAKLRGGQIVVSLADPDAGARLNRATQVP
jgi:hypothetical protein